MRSFSLLVMGCAGCSSSEAQPVDASVDQPSIIDSVGPDTSSTFDSAPPPCKQIDPTYLPTGWIRYDDYAPCTGFYVPSDKQYLPSPIAWEPCDSDAGVGGCRKIKLDWGPLPTGLIYLDADGAVAPDGHVILMTDRPWANSSGDLDHYMSLIADADGPVYSAILTTAYKRFNVGAYAPPSFAPPRWILSVTENLDNNVGGYLLGATNRPSPTRAKRLGGYAERSAVVGDLGVLEIANNTSLPFYDFDTGAYITSVNKASLPLSFEWMFHDSVFWQGYAGHTANVGRWDKKSGSVDFVDFGLDAQHGAGSFGTDGTDMAWVEGHGTNGLAFATADYWTSSYTTDKSQLKPRRLRTAPVAAFISQRVAVGCGRMVSWSAFGAWIVRLSDGWGWWIPSGAWAWQDALAVTCTEAFFRVIYPSGSTIARLQFDQLGPGLPAD